MTEPLRETATLERRIVSRYAPNQALNARIRGRIQARVLDISSRGALCEVVGTLAPGQTVDVRLLLGSGEIGVRARVCRCHVAGMRGSADGERGLVFRTGLEFEEMAPEAIARLTSDVLFEAVEVTSRRVIEGQQRTVRLFGGK